MRATPVFGERGGLSIFDPKNHIALTSYIPIGETRIACEEFVPAQPRSPIPILFLHDSLGSISVWKDFPKTIATQTGLRTIVYDRQGYGSSDPFPAGTRDNQYLEEQADFLIRVLDALSIDSCLLFGHSDGGSIALIAGAKYPERIRGIITEGAHVFVEDITLAGIREALQLYQTTGLKAKLERHHGTKTEALFNVWTQTWLTPAFRHWNIEHFLPAINCPVLVIQGENDEYGSVQQVESIYTQVKGHSEKQLIAGAGHTPHKEAKEETIRLVSDFIRKLLNGQL